MPISGMLNGYFLKDPVSASARALPGCFLSQERPEREAVVGDGGPADEPASSFSAEIRGKGKEAGRSCVSPPPPPPFASSSVFQEALGLQRARRVWFIFSF